MTPPLKPFIINIKGDYCEVPHPERIIIVHNDSENEIPELELTDIDAMVICHEILCHLRNRLDIVLTKSEMKKQAIGYEKYHFGVSTGKEKLKKINIQIFGNYCEEFIPERKLSYNFDAITSGQTVYVLYEVVCTFRNKLSETMSRDELASIADKHKIYNFGMLKTEEPFETR